MNKREQALYDRLPKALSRKEKLAWMAKWGVQFELLPRAQRTKFLKQAYRDQTSQFIVKHKGKLISVPQGNVLVTLERLGIEITAECILL